jgi:serine/threonine protein kinase
MPAARLARVRVASAAVDHPAEVGRYRVVAPIGKGGMAQVYRARLSGLGGFERDVAVKVLLPEYAAEPDFVDMLLDEARIAAAIDHPAVVQVLDVGRDGDLFYLVMEYVDGADLRSRVRATPAGRLPLEPALFVAVEVLRGLEAVHNAVDGDGRPRRIVHRDVSPANVLVSKAGVVKLGDFGIAHATSRLTRTRNGAVKGKLRYMAPEQVQARAVDGRADLYAVGVVLCELLLGPAFCEPRPSQRRLTDLGPTFVWSRARAVREHPGVVPEDVLGILDRALAENPAQRFADAAEFRRVLVSALHRRQPGFGPEDLARVLDGLGREAVALTLAEQPDGITERHQVTPPEAPPAPAASSSTVPPMLLAGVGPAVPMPLVGSGRTPMPLPPPPPVGAAWLASSASRSDGLYDEEQKPTTPIQAAPVAMAQPMPRGYGAPTGTWVHGGLRRGRLGRVLKRLGLAADATRPDERRRRVIAVAISVGLLAAVVVSLAIVLTLRLTAPAPAPVEPARALAAPPVVVTSPVPEAARPPAMGALVVSVPNGGAVTLGSTTYPTPCRLDLPPGSYTVKVRRPGRRGATSRTIVIEPGAVADLR